MRLLELSLLAYGPFSGKVVDLSREGPVVHLIYGPNEAGKSTTLRAVGALLYGIAHNTRDAHTHANPELRIGGRVADTRGNVLSVVRRKGRKNTLLGDDGEAIGDAVLSPYLAGVPEAAFISMFGLDHERLRHGGEQLLAGQGDLGESLFEAGAGAEGVHEVLESLRQEADALFRPRGKKVLNEAIRVHDEAQKRAKERVLRAQAWRDQQRELEAARQQAAELRERRDSLRREEARLSRAGRVLPLLAKRADALKRRAELGALPVLAEGAADARRKAQAQLAQCLSRAEPIAQQLARLRGRREALDIQESLAQQNPEVIRGVRNRLGNHLKAAEDLPRRRGQLRALQEEAQALLRSLGRDETLDEVESLRVDRALLSRVRRLSQTRAGLSEREAAAVRDRDEREAALAAQRARLAALSGQLIAGTLEDAVADARSAGDLDTAIEEASDEVAQLERQLGDRMAALGGFDGSAEALARLSLPGVETLRRFAREGRELEGRLEACRKRREALDEGARRVARSLDAIERGDAPPDEAELEAARARRGSHLSALRDALSGGRAAEPPLALVEALEEDTAEADRLVDRMRREARQVSERASLQAEAAALEGEQTSLAQEQAVLEQALAEHDGRWRALWAATPVAPLPPDEMVAWLARAERVTALVEPLAAVRARVARLSARRQRVLHALEASLAEDGGAAVSEALPALLRRAERALTERRDRAREQEACRRRIAEETAALERAERDLSRARELSETWQLEWDAQMPRLGLSAGASVEEAQAVVEGLSELFAKVDEVRQMQGRIDGMERDARNFATEVARLVDRHLFQLRELDTAEAAEELVQRYEGARAAIEQRRRIDADIEEVAAEQEALAARADEARRALSRLVEAAAVATVDELPALEERVETARALDRRVAELEDELLQQGEGDSLEQLTRLSDDIDRDQIRPRLAELERDLSELEETHRDTVVRVDRLERGMQGLERSGGAADAAAEAEQCLSRVRRLSRDYAAVKLAQVVLEREIRHYRDAHQGPIVGEAAKLFRRLTLGAYQGLEVGYRAGDDPVLLCVDADGKRRDVAALSDGTRDQLYLALRLSSIAHFARHAEPLPLVLDDVLIHFDDDRARAALEVLGDLSEVTQILFFTHHARLRDLARSAIPAVRLVEHELASASRRAVAPAP